MTGTKLWSRAGGTTLVVALVFIAATAVPSGAHQPGAHRSLNPSHFNGDGTGGNHGPDSSGEANEAQILGDRFDGMNDAYMFRSVASPEANYYEWYVCASSNNPYTGQCGEPVARDTTANYSDPPPGAARVAAFSAPFNIPPSAEGTQAVKGVACIEGPPSRPMHCVLNTIDPVHLDDASTTPHDPTDSGEFTQPDHGDAVLNSGFTAVVVTSESDIGRVFFCLDVGTNASTGESASPQTGCDSGSAFDTSADDSPACSSVPGADCWEVAIDPPDNAEFSLAAVEQDDATSFVSSGSGDCEGDSLVGGDGSDVGDDCQLDKLYLTSLETIPSKCPGFANDRRNQIVGTASGDTLVGSKGPDVMCGRGGKDVIRGLGGKDLLIGAGGPDRLSGGPGADLLKGGPRKDRLSGGPGRDRCRGGGGKDSLVSCER